MIRDKVSEALKALQPGSVHTVQLSFLLGDFGF